MRWPSGVASLVVATACAGRASESAKPPAAGAPPSAVRQDGEHGSVGVAAVEAVPERTESPQASAPASPCRGEALRIVKIWNEECQVKDPPREDEEPPLVELVIVAEPE